MLEIIKIRLSNKPILFFYLQLMSALKTGDIANNGLGTLARQHYDHSVEPIPTERSG